MYYIDATDGRILKKFVAMSDAVSPKKTGSKILPERDILLSIEDGRPRRDAKVSLDQMMPESTGFDRLRLVSGLI
jgi:hypothetical protein